MPVAFGGGTTVVNVHKVVVPFTVVLRLVMGWIFLWAGLEKAVNGFTAAGFLQNATSGPLQEQFAAWGADSAALAVIDPLVTYGQILMGLAIIFGVATRAALFCGGIMMLLFYIAQFPPEHNPFVDYYAVYVVVYLMLGALGAGRILGFGGLFENLPWIRDRVWPRYLLG
ncbi:MAG: DoxX family protein [Chloroflexota bacterium]|nr:DoxX family protein [Chloroflexota bacterium]